MYLDSSYLFNRIKFPRLLSTIFPSPPYTMNMPVFFFFFWFIYVHAKPISFGFFLYEQIPPAAPMNHNQDPIQCQPINNVLLGVNIFDYFLSASLDSQPGWSVSIYTPGAVEIKSLFQWTNTLVRTEKEIGEMKAKSKGRFPTFLCAGGYPIRSMSEQKLGQSPYG